MKMKEKKLKKKIESTRLNRQTQDPCNESVITK
jgi:hypothetical protein